ncbi:hypothetical protein GQ600_1061 [Phytophthora cactorum]|nr:hypothetical protein GQ600_1061 [Phytophthora cactorum]
MAHLLEQTDERSAKRTDAFYSAAMKARARHTAKKQQNTQRRTSLDPYRVTAKPLKRSTARLKSSRYTKSTSSAFSVAGLDSTIACSGMIPATDTRRPDTFPLRRLSSQSTTSDSSSSRVATPNNTIVLVSSTTGNRRTILSFLARLVTCSKCLIEANV